MALVLFTVIDLETSGLDWDYPRAMGPAFTYGKPIRELTLDDPEVWMPLDDYLGLYEVSSHGRVRTLEHCTPYLHGESRVPLVRRIPARILRPQASGPLSHYPQVGLYRNARKAKLCKVHWLVAMSFLGPTPPGHMVLHADDNGWHNAPFNLRFGTKSDNTLDAINNGRLNRSDDGRLQSGPHSKRSGAA